MANPLRAEQFLASSWTGRAEILDMIGRRVRALNVEFRGERPPADGGFVMEEALTYDHGGELRRSWHVSREGDGLFIGFEPSQGGRVVIRDTRRGMSLTYDRLKVSQAINVANLRLRLTYVDEATVRVGGWTSVFAVMPVLRTKGVLRRLVQGGVPSG